MTWFSKHAPKLLPVKIIEPPEGLQASNYVICRARAIWTPPAPDWSLRKSPQTPHSACNCSGTPAELLRLSYGYPTVILRYGRTPAGRRCAQGSPPPLSSFLTTWTSTPMPLHPSAAVPRSVRTYMCIVHPTPPQTISSARSGMGRILTVPPRTRASEP